jgi:hypothetical protein
MCSEPHIPRQLRSCLILSVRQNEDRFDNSEFLYQDAEVASGLDLPTGDIGRHGYIGDAY